MNQDICKERSLFRSGLVQIDSEQKRLRAYELEALWKELAIEKIEIHHYGRAYISDCPALAGLRKSFPTKDVYNDMYGCTACAYHDGVWLQHVRCKWRAVQNGGESS